MTTCARCGHELGIGRFCLNCGHRVGEPVPVDERRAAVPADAPLPDQAAATVRAWLPWALGVLLVVVLLTILASCLGGDGRDDAATEATQDTPPEQGVAASPPVDLTKGVKVSAPTAAPATTDLDGELVGYEKGRMLDATPATAWRTPGDATGETLTFTLGEPSTIRRVGLLNGYAKQVSSGSGLVDWYPQNRRIIAVEWVFDDGTTIRQDLVEAPRLQRLSIDPVTTSTVRLRLLTVTDPGPGDLGGDFTAISDVLIAGTPAA